MRRRFSNGDRFRPTTGRSRCRSMAEHAWSPAWPNDPPDRYRPRKANWPEGPGLARHCALQPPSTVLAHSCVRRREGGGDRRAIRNRNRSRHLSGDRGRHLQMKSCVGRLWSAELFTGIDRTLVTPSESPGLSWVPSTPTPRSAFSNLGSNLDRQGRHAEAEPVHRRAMEIGEKVLGPEHSDTATGVANLGSNLAHHCPQNRDTSPVINKPNTGRIEATLDGFLRSRPNNLGLRPETRPWLSACPLNT